MNVVRLANANIAEIRSLFYSYGLQIELIDSKHAIPGSHWGDEEAGLIKNTLYARTDTPVHSVFHEACHWLLMNKERKEKLHTNAGGTMMEENAVCYLQILLADELNDFTCEQMMQDMDAWGYSFRLGSTKAWFENDADDALAFLHAHSIAHDERVKLLLSPST